eukprot:100004-Chlamydomonas_euryale.AAC.2
MLSYVIYLNSAAAGAPQLKALPCVPGCAMHAGEAPRAKRGSANLSRLWPALLTCPPHSLTLFSPPPGCLCCRGAVQV